MLNIFQIFFKYYQIFFKYLQIFFCSLVVLLTIRSGISMIERQLKKVVVNLKRTPSWSSDEDNLAAEAGNLNRVFLKKETGDRECKDSYDMDITAAVSTLQKKWIDIEYSFASYQSEKVNILPKSNKKCVLFIIVSIKAKSVVIVNVVSLEEERRRTEWMESEGVWQTFPWVETLQSCILYSERYWVQIYILTTSWPSLLLSIYLSTNYLVCTMQCQCYRK